MIELKLNETTLELTMGTYKESFKNIDKTQTSEGGTTLRSVTRTGIRTLDVAYTCDGTEKAKLDALARAESLTATLYSEEYHDTQTWECYMEGYSSSLKVESSEDRFYKVSFKLLDLTQ